MTLVLSKKHCVSIIILSGVVSVLCMLLLTPKASAATLNVVAGNDAIADNNQCQLSEAITNINGQAQTHDDCLAGDGNNDTINLPTGTITLTTDAIYLSKPVTIAGQGIDSSIIDGNNGQFAFSDITLYSTGEVSISSFTITAFKGIGLMVNSAASNTIVNINSIVIDGTNSAKSSSNAIGGASFDINGSVNLNDVHIHDIQANGAVSLFGLSFHSRLSGTSNVNLNKVTIAGLSSDDSVIAGIALLTGLVDGSFTPGTINASIENSTITNLASNGSAITGIASYGIVNSGTANIALNLQNNTIYGFSGSGTRVGLGLASVASGLTDVSNVTINATNNIISSSTSGCVLAGDMALAFGLPDPSAGTINQTLTSNGGNITDDASCNNYFNQPTDKNEVPNLPSFFSNLTNNGGSIPTIKPLPGNVAIDGGICTDQTPNTDARGITRPQGQTCDSGAYEVEQASHDTNQSTSPKQTKLITPAGVINKSFTTVSTDGLPKDNADVNYQYPLGLSTFTLEVPSGSTQAVSLFYETSLKAKQLVPRKYKTTNKIFSNIPNAQLSDVVIDGKTGVQLTYNITDGGELDQDGQVNGIIIDPVGLAQEDPSLLTNTGDFILVAIPIGTALIIATVIVTYVDYRKHKKPLLDINRDLAKSYTYWHHLKTVTIPLFSYRLSFAFEKKSNHLNISRF
jgi:hypothetical protein